jgi:hypothetical protein
MGRSGAHERRDEACRFRGRLGALLIGCLLAAGLPVQAQEGSEPALVKYYAEDIKAAMLDHIAREQDGEGIFRLEDDRTGETLELRFVKIHDPVRRIDADTYFACTDFHVNEELDKVYDLDFWLRPEHGRLVVYDARVHKEPQWSLLYGWYKQPRYTFVNDRVVELY